MWQRESGKKERMKGLESKYAQTRKQREKGWDRGEMKRKKHTKKEFNIYHRVNKNGGEEEGRWKDSSKEQESK